MESLGRGGLGQRGVFPSGSVAGIELADECNLNEASACELGV